METNRVYSNSQSEKDLFDMGTRADREDYFINPRIEERADRIFVPCGIGNTDYGFFIYGIKKNIDFENRTINVFSVVYNYLIRCSRITEKDIPLYIQSRKTEYAVEYRSIFRIAIILLQMIKNGYARRGILTISFDGDKTNLKLAVDMINDYAARFSRLAKSSFLPLQVQTSPTGTHVSIRQESGIYAKDNHEFISNARELWYGRYINYNLTEKDCEDIEYLLHEISPFAHFKEGQYEALCSMLRAEGHSVCIMPTGSGKSLVFYFLSILQPLPVYVVAPTDMLISDQIRNLRSFHHIDDVAHLKLTGDKPFRRFKAYNKLLYLTPTTLQNRDLLVAFRYINNGTELVGMREERVAPGSLAAYIVLDEIHCLSNWGHDFRPEYLMLSKFLNKYLDNIYFRGFTATANYTVVEDVQKQLSIPEKNFFSPVAFDNYNISYSYISCSSTEEMSNRLCEICKDLIQQNERTIVFCKGEQIAKKLVRMIGYEADLFSEYNPASYYSFAEGNTKVLISNEDLGIGINLPNVKNIVHYGLPLSKNEYIQEIGRAGRSNEHVRSFVLYLKETPDNVPDSLLRRSTSIDEIPKLIQGYDNDFSDIFRKLTNDCPSKAIMLQRLLAFCKTFDYQQNATEVRRYSPEEIGNAKQMLFMLYASGFINDWYFYSGSANSPDMDIFIDICSTNADLYRRDKNKMLNRMKERSAEFYNFMGAENRGSVAKINWSESIEEILEVYVEWYYLKFLYHHNEQFLDLYELIHSNVDSDSDNITDSIKSYFQLPFTQLRNDELYFNRLSMEELMDKIHTGIGRDTIINIERIISNRYSLNLDVVLFFCHLQKKNELEESRFDRIRDHCSENDMACISNGFSQIYEKCDLFGRMKILNYIEAHGKQIGIEYAPFWDTVYAGQLRDQIYYAMAFKKMNEQFRRFAK